MKNHILKKLSETNPEALVADGFDEAVVGVGYQGPKGPIVVYSASACVECLQKRDGMDFEEALEFFEFNVKGSWVGENTPIFLYDRPEDI
tara:strand:- start:2848 stop:3117 length:270 start_codon:yes stop_codon:yes gene_type:complete